MRFLYCACAISALLDDWSGVDVDLALAYIDSCKGMIYKTLKELSGKINIKITNLPSHKFCTHKQSRTARKI